MLLLATIIKRQEKQLSLGICYNLWSIDFKDIADGNRICEM